MQGYVREVVRFQNLRIPRITGLDEKLNTHDASYGWADYDAAQAIQRKMSFLINLYVFIRIEAVTPLKIIGRLGVKRLTGIANADLKVEAGAI